MEALKAQFGNTYAFSLEEPMYLRATRKVDGTPTESDALELFKAFRMTGDGKYRQSGFVYLNVYDNGGQFVTQVYYDPNTQRVDFSQQEYY
jgi:hypothetical protein